MSQQQPTQEFAVGDKHAQGGPNTELDVVDKIVSPDVYDDLAGQLGTGNYSDSEFWQQIEEYKFSLYGEALFDRVISEQTIYEAKYRLGERGWYFYDPERGDGGKEFDKDGWQDWDEGDRQRKAKKAGGRSEVIRRRGEHLWQLLPEHEQVKVIEEFSGGSMRFRTPHARMIEARHEGSKSRDARLMDNFFGRVKELLGSDDVDKRTKSKLLGGGR